jgi:hypothetical protein
MKKITPISMLVCALVLCASNAMANPAEEASQAIRAGGRASGNASASAGHSLAATGQLASGVVATPLLASGAVAVGVGSAALQAGGSLMNAATSPIGTPLPVTDETVSILPPNKALQQPTTKN